MKADPVVGAAAGYAASKEFAAVGEQVRCHERAVRMPSDCDTFWISHAPRHNLLRPDTVIHVVDQGCGIRMANMQCAAW